MPKKDKGANDARGNAPNNKPADEKSDSTKPILINPLTDFGFKRLFGRKRILLSFLNSLFAGEYEFIDLTYSDKEIKPAGEGGRTAIYDIACHTSNGKIVIVEMQRAEHENMIERTLFYASAAIHNQAKKGKDWQYDLEPAVLVIFTDFTLAGLPNAHTGASLRTDDDAHTRLTDKLRLVYLQLPLFLKEEAECESGLDRWLYNIKNMNAKRQLSFKETMPIFKEVEDAAAYAKMTAVERRRYDKALDAERVILSAMKLQRKKGIAEGITRGRAETSLEYAKKMKERGMDINFITEITGLSEEQINAL